jgi:hypothetical protein
MNTIKNDLCHINGLLSVGPIYWKRNNVRWLDGEISGIAQCGADYLINAKGLPEEFIFEYVMRINTKDDDAIFAFCGKWGLPFSPYRETWAVAANDTMAFQRQEALKAIQATELILDNKYGLAEKKISKSETARAFGRNEDTIRMCISLAEARHTLEVLGDIARDIQEYLQSDGNMSAKPDLGVIILASCNPSLPLINSSYPAAVLESVAKTIGSEYSNPVVRLYQRSLLTSAIANQLLDTLASADVWRRCAANNCGRIFKHKSSPDATRRNRQSLYCSERCYERQKRENRQQKLTVQTIHTLSDKSFYI